MSSENPYLNRISGVGEGGREVIFFGIFKPSNQKSVFTRTGCGTKYMACYRESSQPDHWMLYLGNNLISIGHW